MAQQQVAPLVGNTTQPYAATFANMSDAALEWNFSQPQHYEFLTNTMRPLENDSVHKDGELYKWLHKFHLKHLLLRMRDFEIEPWFDDPTQAPKMAEFMTEMKSSNDQRDFQLWNRLMTISVKIRLVRMNDAQLEHHLRSRVDWANIQKMISCYGRSDRQSDCELVGRLIRIRDRYQDLHFEARVGSTRCCFQSREIASNQHHLLVSRADVLFITFALHY